MKTKTQHIFEVVLLFIALAGLPAGNSWANEDSKYLNAVREFADNVLKYGRDTYGPKHTPLFVDGVNIHTHEPVKWIAPNGDRWILSNLASQQNLFRTLDGLTKISGDPEYRQAAVEAIEYAFAHLRSPNGLLHWGGHVAYDAQADEMCMCEEKGYNHELKFHFPYYELMWEVNPKATRSFIEAFWSAHILDWSNLDMNRHGNMAKPLGDPWEQEYGAGPVFFWGRGLSFICTGSDLFYAGSVLSKLSGEKPPLVWSKRLAYRYVETRNPKTGIGGYQFSQSKASWCDGPDVRGDRAQYQFGDDFKGHFVVEGSLFPCYGSTPMVSPRICEFLLGEMLGSDSEEFTQWALEELTAWGKAAYRKEDNSWIPMLTDGTSLEGYVCKKDGYFGPKGRVIKAGRAGSASFWTYALAYRTTADPFMWEMARNIASANGYGDIGKTAKHTPLLKTATDCSEKYALLGFLELYKKTDKRLFLNMAKRIGENILSARFHKGFFVPSKKHIYARFDYPEPLILLHLHNAVEAKTAALPWVWPSRSFFACSYRHKGVCYDTSLIYTLTESAEPPWTLSEAAAAGEIDKVKSLLAKKDSVNDSSFKAALQHASTSGHRQVVELLLAHGADVNAGGITALHHAAKNGREQVAELLIAKGANVNAKNIAGDTPLHYAARYRRKDIVELLITKGANVNAKNDEGQTPLNIAMRQNRKEIVELLRSKGAIMDISSIHIAAQVGDLAKVNAFLEDGNDINAGDDRGFTPLHYAVQGGHKEVAEFLIAKGADINIKDKNGYTPFHYALWYSKTDIARLLIEKGADVHGKDQSGYTPLHWAVMMGNRELTELVLSKGADVNVKGKAGETPLDFAIYGGKAIGQLFVEKGAEASSLQSAAFIGDLDKVKAFLDGGVDVNAKNVAGASALHAAASGGRKEVAELLLAKGADINISVRNGQTPLHWSARGGSREVVELLVSKGADVNAVDKNRVTALHTAAEEGNRDMATLLIGKGADVNAKDKWVWTPLHYACWKNRKETVEFLLAKGAGLNTREEKGKTPLAVAKEEGHTEIVELLLKHGAKE